MKRTWTKKIRPLIDLGDHLGVPLSNGAVALIDHQDRAIAEGWNWSATARRGGVYAHRGQPQVMLHRAILDAPLVDHRNGNTLDNRRANLRVVTHVENARNRAIQRNSRTGFKGVSFRKDRGTWLAAIRVDGRLFKLGTFSTAEAAARAYDDAARSHFGEHATVNFPNPGERGANPAGRHDVENHCA